MAQERTTAPSGTKRILKLDGSIVDEFGNVIQQANPTPGGLASLTPQATENEGLSIFEPREFVSGLIKAGTAATGLLGGPSLPMAAMRTVLGAGGDAIAAGVKGEDPLEAGIRGGAMNLGGEGLAKAIPEVTTRLAILSGAGLKGIKDLGEGSAAFNREAERRRIPIPVGGKRSRVQGAREEAGKALEAAETSNPNTVPLRSLTNANADFHARSINTMEPMTQRATIDAADQKFIRQQALARLHLEESDLAQAVNVGMSNRGIVLQLAQQLGRRPTSKDMEDLILNHLVDKVNLSARETGELMRGVRSQGDDVIKARKDKVFVAPPEQVRGQIAANNADTIRDRYQAIDEDTRTPFERFQDVDQGGDMARANKRFSDLATMERISGGVRRDPGILGVRGAIGASLGSLLGLGPIIGGAAGLGATPRNISGLGFLLSNASRYGPSGYRAGEAVEDVTPDKKPKRRDPK